MIDKNIYKSEVKRYTLFNGLKVEYIKKDGFKTKCVMLSVKYGSLDNAFKYKDVFYKYPAGIAHAIEHLIYKKDESDAFLELSNMGVSPNASTTYDATTFEFVTTKDIIKPLKVTLDFVFNAKFSKKNLENERGIILSEAKILDDNNDYLITSNINKVLYENSTFENKSIGSISDIFNINIDMLEKSYEAFYKPCNMLLSIVGDFSTFEIDKLLNDFFKNKSYDFILPKREDNIINSITNKNTHLIKLKNNNLNKVYFALRANISNEVELEIYNALFYIYYSMSSDNTKKLENNGYIEYGYSYISEESNRFFYFVFETSTNNIDETINKLKDNYLNLDINLINKQRIDGYKKQTFGEYIPLCNDIYDLCDNVHSLSLIDMDFFKKIDIVLKLNEDILKKYFDSFKKMDFTFLYTKK